MPGRIPWRSRHQAILNALIHADAVRGIGKRSIPTVLTLTAVTIAGTRFYPFVGMAPGFGPGRGIIGNLPRTFLCRHVLRDLRVSHVGLVRGLAESCRGTR